MQVSRVVAAIKEIALTLNQHYPARLHCLYLVEAPVVVQVRVLLFFFPQTSALPGTAA